MNVCYNNENSCSYILYKQDGTEVRTNKRRFETSDDAIRVAQYMNSKDSTLHKFVAYKCSKCQGYHIGHTKYPLTDKAREKARKFIKFAKK